VTPADEAAAHAAAAALPALSSAQIARVATLLAPYVRPVPDAQESTA
jgi:hypothetical protein